MNLTQIDLAHSTPTPHRDPEPHTHMKHPNARSQATSSPSISRLASRVHHKRVLRGALAGAALCGAALLSSAALGQDPHESGVAQARSTLEQWVETRRVISKEKRDWALGRELLDERIALVQREIDSLRERTAQAQSNVAEADVKRAELAAESERLKASSAELAELVAGFEARTRALLARLPDPIRERVKPLSQGIPAAGSETKQGLGLRFQNVIGILNEVNKFQREISLASEVRELADGSSVEVTALYIGVGQGYYATADGRVAGVGRAGPEGWSWTQLDGGAAEVAAAIAILKNDRVASFVQLPVRVD